MGCDRLPKDGFVKRNGKGAGKTTAIKKSWYKERAKLDPRLMLIINKVKGLKLWGFRVKAVNAPDHLLMFYFCYRVENGKIEEIQTIEVPYHYLHCLIRRGKKITMNIVEGLIR